MHHQNDDLPRRLYRALTADRDVIFPLLDDPSMEVLKALLKNPALMSPAFCCS